MRKRIERTKAVLSDPDAALSEKIHMAGILAIAVVAGASGPDTDEARETVIAFWRETEIKV